MKRSLKSTFLVALTLLALAFSTLGATPAYALAGTRIIGSLPGTSPTGYYISSAYRAGVAFTMPASSYQISEVSLELSGSSSNVPLITIQGDNAGFPDGAPVATFDNPAGGVGARGTYVFTLSSPVTLNASTKYWLVVTSSSGDFNWHGYDDGSYSGLASYSGTALAGPGWSSISAKFTFELTGPATTNPDTFIDSGPSGTITTNSATFTYHGTDDVTVDPNFLYGCFLEPIDTAYQLCNGGTITYNGLADGTYTFYVYAQDEAGNYDLTDASQSFTVALDTTAPDTTITPAAGNTGASGSFSFTGSDNVTPAGSLTFQCRQDFGFYGTWHPCSSPYTYDATFPEGVYTLNVRAIDAEMNVDASPATVTWTADHTAPVVTILSGPAASVSNYSATFTFSATDNITPAGSLILQCGLDGTAWENCASPKTYDNLALGHHWVWIRAIDEGGNIGEINAAYEWDVVLPTTERLKNGSFEIYSTTSKIPLSWRAVKFGQLDGKDTTVKKTGKASLKLTGGTATKTLTQNVILSGSANDILLFTYYIKGSKLPKTGTCQIEALFYNGASYLGKVSSLCPTTASFNWKPVKWMITVATPYTKVVVKITFKKAAGTIWFDGMSLKK